MSSLTDLTLPILQNKKDLQLVRFIKQIITGQQGKPDLDKQPPTLRSSLSLTLIIALSYWGVSHLIWISFAKFGMLPAPVWPAAAIAFISAYCYSLRALPGLYIGAFLANFFSLNAPFEIALGIGLMNSIGPVIAARMVKNCTGDLIFSSVRSVFAFLCCGVILHAALTATGGITSLVLGGKIPLENAPLAWLRWWTAHSTGTLILAPLLLSVLFPTLNHHAAVNRKALLFTVISSITITIGIFFYIEGKQHAFIGLPLLLIVPTAWIAISSSLFSSSLFLLTTALLATLGTVQGLGPFYLSGNDWPLLALALLLVVLTVTSLVLFSLSHERWQNETKLHQAGRIVANCQESILVTDINGKIISVNPAFTEITGYSAEEAIGQKPSLIKSKKHGQDFYDLLWELLTEKGQWSGEIWNRRKSGELFISQQNISAIRDESGELISYVSVMNDVTDSKEKDERIRHLAYHDPLTGLPNRSLMLDRLEQSLQLARRNGNSIAILFIDVDNFKKVNDLLGHPVGDQLLKDVAQKLSSCIRISDTVARLGGDEFVILLEQPGHIEDIARLSEKIISRFSELSNQKIDNISIGASLGISIFPENGEDSASLLKQADTAMYAAKEAGRNTYCFFRAEMTKNALEKLNLEKQLHHAIHNNLLTLNYQPKISLEDESVIGFEALCRWQNEGKFISPEVFIPLAEQGSMIIDLGEWVIEQVCSQISLWYNQGLGYQQVAINVHIDQLHAPDFAENLLATIERYQLSTGLIEIELTESALVSEPQQTAQILQKLRTHGVKISIDDFGTGYSSLSYLPQLPIDTIKIDRSFIMGATDVKENIEVIRTIIALGSALNYNIIAEGVETLEDVECLKQMHCPVAQGYYYSRPQPADQLRSWLHA